eukprot:11188893-Lingulodinium_polyedra.AAC.1
MPPPGMQLPQRVPDGRLAVSAEDAYNSSHVKVTPIAWRLGIGALFSANTTKTLFSVRASRRWRRGLSF